MDDDFDNALGDVVVFFLAVVSMLVIVNPCLHAPVARDSSKSHGVRTPAWFTFHGGLRSLGRAGSSYVPSTRV